MFATDSSPTNPAATAALTVDTPSASRKKSWIMSAACSRMPMPAVTLHSNTIHSSQNCGVLIALAAETFEVVTIGLAATVEGSKCAGRQPGAGTRTVNTPSIITMK